MPCYTLTQMPKMLDDFQIREKKTNENINSSYLWLISSYLNIEYLTKNTNVHRAMGGI